MKKSKCRGGGCQEVTEGEGDNILLEWAERPNQSSNVSADLNE